MPSKACRAKYCKSLCTVKFFAASTVCMMIFFHLNQFFRSRIVFHEEFSDHKLNIYSSNSILLRSHTIWYNYLSKLTDSRSQQVYKLWLLSYKPTSPSGNLRQKPVPKYEYFESATYSNYSIRSIHSDVDCGKIYNISNISSHPQQRINLLIFSNCVDEFAVVSFANIYTFYDKMIADINEMAVRFPNAIIVWSLPAFPEEMDAELVLLHHHIITTILIKIFGLVVMQPYNLPSIEGEKEYVGHLIRQFIQIYCEISPSDISAYKKNVISEQYLSLILNTVHQYLRRIRFDDSAKSFKTSMSLQNHCNKYIYTRKYDSFCMPRLMNVHPVLVTGLGGSGTHFVANKLRSAGFKFYHEDLAEDGSVVGEPNPFHSFHPLLVSSPSILSLYPQSLHLTYLHTTSTCRAGFMRSMIGSRIRPIRGEAISDTSPTSVLASSA